jgi:hypothetical protein
MKVTLSPTIWEFYAQFPDLMEALTMMQPPGPGPEYEEMHRAYLRLLEDITTAYILWSTPKLSMIVTGDPIT